MTQKKKPHKKSTTKYRKAKKEKSNIETEKFQASKPLYKTHGPEREMSKAAFIALGKPKNEILEAFGDDEDEE